MRARIASILIVTFALAYLGLVAGIIVPGVQILLKNKNEKKELRSYIGKALGSEAEACEKVKMDLPQWERTCDEYDDPRCWRFLCTDDQGFLHEVLRPVCNQHGLHWCR